MKNQNTNTNSTKTFSGFASMKALLAACAKIIPTLDFKVRPASEAQLKSLRGFANADESIPMLHVDTNHEAIAIKRVLKQQRKLRKTDVANLDNIVQGEDLAVAGETYSAWYAGSNNKIRFAMVNSAKVAKATTKASKASRKANTTKPKASAPAKGKCAKAADALLAGNPVIITDVQGGETTLQSVEDLVAFALQQRDLANAKAKPRKAKAIDVTMRL